MSEGLNIYHEFSDDDLILLIGKRDRDAFTELHMRYRGVLYLNAYKLTGDIEDAEDIVQEVFISVWERAGKIKVTKGVKSYLYSAVSYRFFDMLDHRGVMSRYEESFRIFSSNNSLITDNQVRENELNRLMDEQIAHLPEKMRQVFELSRKKHLSPEEIARELNISDKTVKRQLANAVKILRPKLEGLLSVLFTGIL